MLYNTIHGVNRLQTFGVILSTGESSRLWRLCYLLGGGNPVVYWANFIKMKHLLPCHLI